MSDSPILFVRKVASRLGGTVMLEDMNLVIEGGSIHARSAKAAPASQR
jgi:ribose transport system ATP-binding protein